MYPQVIEIVGVSVELEPILRVLSIRSELVEVRGRCAPPGGKGGGGGGGGGGIAR